MQHVFHDGKVVYTVREAGHGVIKYFKSNVISTQEHDLNDDGKMDLLFLMPLGSSEVIEAFFIAGGKFLSPLSSDDLFDKHGNKHPLSDVISRMKEKPSQQPAAQVQSEGAPSD